VVLLLLFSFGTAYAIEYDVDFSFPSGDPAPVGFTFYTLDAQGEGVAIVSSIGPTTRTFVADLPEPISQCYPYFMAAMYSGGQGPFSSIYSHCPDAEDWPEWTPPEIGTDQVFELRLRRVQ